MTVWDQHVKQWEFLGSPLRPSAADVQNCSLWIKERIHFNPPKVVLLLGVTPELVKLPWPENTRLLAVDMNLSMINEILPKNARINPQAIAGNWLQLPLTDSSIDIVIGDGCYSTLAENDYEQMTNEIRRVMVSSGMFIMRFFTRPESAESIESVQKDFLLGKINNFHALKWRIAMALHGCLSRGVCVNTIWNTWQSHFRNYQAQIKSLNWAEEIIRTIDSYKNSKISYTFPTLSEIRSALSKQFKEHDIYIPEYSLGERCPSLKLSPL